MGKVTSPVDTVQKCRGRHRGRHPPIVVMPARRPLARIGAVHGLEACGGLPREIVLPASLCAAPPVPHPRIEIRDLTDNTAAEQAVATGAPRLGG